MLDFEQSFSLVEPAFLITIVSEAILKDSVVQLLTQLKVRSYTISEITGTGRQPRRSADPDTQSELVETTLEIKAIASQEISNVILYALKEQQRDFAVFVYRQPVEALIQD
jgi:nitrogen regulatory protein PII